MEDVLGGFAEDPKDIDGNQRDFEAFNFCLAEEYFYALKAEDFDVVGEISYDLMENITHWLNYDGDINKNHVDEIKLLRTGKITTSNERTLMDAVIETHNANLAEIFILNGNDDPKLYATVILYDKYENDYYSILNAWWNNNPEKDIRSFYEFLSSLFTYLESLFTSLNDDEDKEVFLRHVNHSIKIAKIPNCFDSNIIVKNEYTWLKELKLLNK